ncbi:MAG: hypothetical protein ACFFD4_37285 [Candidatus Odinarchaeota archaeon]
MSSSDVSRELQTIVNSLEKNYDLSGALLVADDRNDAINNPLIVKILVLFKKASMKRKTTVLGEISDSIRRSGYLCDRIRDEIRVKGVYKIYQFNFEFFEKLPEKFSFFSDTLRRESFPFDPYPFWNELCNLRSLVRPNYLFSTPELELIIHDLESLLLVASRKARPRVIWEIKRLANNQISLEASPLEFNTTIFNRYILLALAESLLQLDNNKQAKFELREKFDSFASVTSINPEQAFTSLVADFSSHYDLYKHDNEITGIEERTNTNGSAVRQPDWQKSLFLRDFLRNWRVDQEYFKEIVSSPGNDLFSSTCYLFLAKKQLELLETICILLDVQYSRLWSANKTLIDRIDSTLPGFYDKLNDLSWKFKSNSQYEEKYHKLIAMGNEFLRWQGIKVGFEHWYRPKKR